jgi:hypothetical protein
MKGCLEILGYVSDGHCGLAALHALGGVTAGAQLKHDPLSYRLLPEASAWHREWQRAHLKHAPQELIARDVAGVSEDERRKIVRENVIRLYDLRLE